jgi:tripartite-type tricarboxylate transporter receptor subunit TctC
MRKCLALRIAALVPVAAVAGLVLTDTGSAQNYPSRQIHVIVAYSAGGTGDVVARQLSNKLGEALGQSIVVENRAGASGALGARAVASATPDGYTLLMGQTAEISINQYLLKENGYDPAKDLEPIALCAVVPLAMVVPNSAPYSTMADYLAFLKSGKPSTFASAGAGTPGHFAGELLRVRLKANMTHVPFKGATPALNDLVGGHVDMYFPGFPAVNGMVQSNTVKLLAVSSATRSPAAPNVPTVKEASGIESFDFTLWAALFAPHGTPKEIVTRLNTEVNKILSTPDMQKRFADLGAEIRVMTVDQVVAFTKSESAKYLQVIKETGVKAE